jgi:hypothetical protein
MEPSIRTFCGCVVPKDLAEAPSGNMTSARLSSSTLILIAALLVLFAMPSNDSLWIDEAATARLASTATFQEWCADMVTGHFSEHQMPLSMGLAWSMAKVFGTSEWGLRAVNLLWGALAVLAFCLAGRRLSILWLPLLLVLHPFFWFYMNEARPYALQIACGAWLFFGLTTFVQEEGRGGKWAIILSAAGFVLCGSSLLGIIPFACILVVLFWIGVRGKYRIERSTWLYLAVGFVLLLPLGVFYLWTLTKGTGGAKLWPVGFKNVAFAVYELAGFMGLGPGREIIRSSAGEHVNFFVRQFAPYLPGLLLLGIAYLFAFGVLWLRRTENENRKVVTASLAVIVLTLGTTYLLALFERWPFWGRHLAPILPFSVAAIAIALKTAMKRGLIGRLIAIMFAFLFIASSLELRFDPRHAKDDYRSAATLARDAISKARHVWWAADPSAAVYYKIPIGSIYLTLESTLNEQPLETFPTPDLIVLSKPDIYDPSGKIDNYMREHDFKVTRVLPAFQIFERQSASHR